VSDDRPVLSAVEIEPPGEARSAVIWLHGLGADGHDFEPVVPLLDLDPALGVRFVFPHAPAIPVTLNFGMVMPAWYDIADLGGPKDHDEAGIRASAARVLDLVARERARGIRPERLVLAGFSQGGAIALHTALRHPEPLAGILALSTYLVLEPSLEEERHAANTDVPIFQAHGVHDPMVPLPRGEAARDRLRELGYGVAWETYPMGHEVCVEEIQAIGRWLGERLA
jgi:phospholipase/carboxylesterase